jgi:hypothetical protein
MAPLVDPREKAEKGLSSLRTPGDRFAYWLNQITSPFVVGLGVLGYVSLSSASRFPDGLRWLTVIGVGRRVPFRYIWWGVKKGKLTDIHVSRRSQRLVPLLVGLISLSRWHAGRAAFAFRFASSCGNDCGSHRLIRCGHADHARGEIQDYRTHRDASRGHPFVLFEPHSIQVGTFRTVEPS